MKLYHYILFLMVLGLNAPIVSSQSTVKFKTSAPEEVYLDSPFQLVYQINASAKDLQAPDFKFFEILAGPFESRSSFHQNINGKSTSSVSLTYTFTLLPTKTGTFRIPGASITANGEKHTSNSITIKVAEPDKTRKSQSEQDFSANENTQRVTSESIFIKTLVSKSEVYEQEAILVTYKLYTLLDVGQFTNVKLPDFNGFLKQEIEQSKHQQLSYEKYKGKNYGSLVLHQTILFPQHSGKINIGDAKFTALLRLQNKTQVKSIFDDFFDSYTNVEKTLIAPGVNITVKELPAVGKPSSFSGAVGNFSIKSSINTKELKSNEAATLTVEISGVGNMKLLRNPDIKFPDVFELYDPKVNNEFSTSTDGLKGSKTIEYLFIPRKSGKFEIPSAELSYFDLTDKTYKTLKTPLYNVSVAPGKGSESVVVGGSYKKDVEELAKDIRYIHTDKLTLEDEKHPIFGTMLFWILFIIPLIVAIILYALLKKHFKANENIALVKNRKANKIAQKRLKKAQKYLALEKRELFYSEVMRAIWNYLSDKLSIPIAELNKENVSVALTSSGIASQTIDELKTTLNTCEYESYAPSSGQKEMDKLYKNAIQIISNIDEQLKKNRINK